MIKKGVIISSARALEEERRKVAAMQKVEQYIKEHNYKGELICIEVKLRGEVAEVAMLKPYGLFICQPDGTVKDDYGVFKEQKEGES